MQQRALLALLLGETLRRCSTTLGPARSTLRRWRHWLAMRHEVFALHLRSHFPEFGRAVDPAAFWSACCAQMPLAAVMAWLDRQLAVP
jgi:hypothetical protein